MGFLERNGKGVFLEGILDYFRVFKMELNDFFFSKYLLDFFFIFDIFLKFLRDQLIFGILNIFSGTSACILRNLFKDISVNFYKDFSTTKTRFLSRTLMLNL